MLPRGSTAISFQPCATHPRQVCVLHTATGDWRGAEQVEAVVAARTARVLATEVQVAAR